MDKDNLASLPDDIFLDIVEHLPTARDVAHLGATSRRANNLISREGWVSFIRQSFPTLKLPPVQQPGQWRGVADRITYLDKCWEKRAFALSEYTDTRQDGGGGAGRVLKKQSVAPSTIVQAGLLGNGLKEVVAWGMGENLMVQTMPCHGKHAHKKRRWREQLGTTLGYRPGTGDITALSIVDRGGSPSIAVGRADGSLRLQSLKFETFGEAQQEIELPTTKHLKAQGPTFPSPGQSTVSWTEWNAQSSLIAAGQGSTVSLYGLTDADLQTLDPIATENMSPKDGVNLNLVRSIKFMDMQTIAVAFGGSTEPLRCAKLTPSGLDFISMGGPNVKMEATLRLHNGPGNGGERTTVRAIEPVGSGGDLLLSAWDDGTYRLQDLRTPSAYDAVYCNRFQTYEAGSSLLVYGMERFISGINSQPNILFFDFRQPKAYHWTTAAACSSKDPSPPCPDNDTIKQNSKVAHYDYPSECIPQDRKMCLYHHASLSNTFRPDATIMLGSRTYDRIHSLAKSSDLSSSFWVGLRGAVHETRLMLAEDAAMNTVKISQPPPKGWTVGKPGVKVLMVETAMGMRDAEDWRDDRWDMNVAEWDFRFRRGKVQESERNLRLDPSMATFRKGMWP